MDGFARIAKHYHTSRGHGAGADHAEEMMDRYHNTQNQIAAAERRMWKWIGIVAAILLVAVILAGCADQTRPSKCPTVREYDEEFSAAFRKQLIARDENDQRIIPEGSPVAIYILDAKLLRDRVRKCQ